MSFFSTVPLQPQNAATTALAAGQQHNITLPPAFRIDVLENLEKALSGDDPEELAKAVGDKGSILKSSLLDPFFQGFKKRTEIDERLKQIAKTQAPQALQAAPAQQAPMWGAAPANPFAAPAQQMTPQQQLGGQDVVQAVLSNVFSYDRLFVADPRNPAMKTVANNEDFEKFGRGDMQGKAIPAHELDPMLVVAADVARLLRENLVRCFQLVLASQGSVQGSKDNEVIKREALRLYFEQQRRVLAVVCRLLRDPFVIEMSGDAGEQWRKHYKTALERLLDTPAVAAGGKVDLVEQISAALRYSVHIEAGTESDQAPVLIKERRKGRETEMRLFCEVLQEMFTFHQVQMAEITTVMRLYLDLSGWFEQAPEESVAFYGCMLSCAIARALVRTRTPSTARPLVIQRSGGAPTRTASTSVVQMPTGLQRGQLDELGRLLECGPDHKLNHDSSPHPARGLIQLVLACAQLQGANDLWQKTLKHAIHNKALLHLDTRIMPCAVLDRWSEYRIAICSAMEEVLDVVLKNMREKVEEMLVVCEQGSPERKHETLKTLLKATAKVYAQLPQESWKMFENHQLELVKRWVIKTISQEDQQEHLYMLKSALFELLCSLFGGVGKRLQDHQARSDVLGDSKELMRLMEQLMDQLQVYPDKLLQELNHYANNISQFLGLQGQMGYVVNPERQSIVSSSYGHSAGAVFQGQLEQRRQDERDRLKDLEGEVVNLMVRWLQLLRATTVAGRLLEEQGVLDQQHPLAPSSLAHFIREMFRLWSRPLCSEIKAELVLLLDAVAHNCRRSMEIEVLQAIWTEFVRGTVLQNVFVVEKVQYAQPQVIPGPMTAFYSEFLDIDRQRGSYDHTLAFLRLLNTIFARVVPWEDCVEVLLGCISLIPRTGGSQSGVLFNNASQKWMVSTGVLQLLVTLLQTMLDSMRRGVGDWNQHAGRPVFDQVLSWVVCSGASDGLNLRARVMDILVLGLQIAEESEEQSELPHLAGTIEMALRLVHLATYVSVEQYDNHELVDVILSERGRGQGSSGRSLLLTIFCYVTLDDEPKLASVALELLRLVCQEKDQEVFQVLASDASPAMRDTIVMAFGSWLQGADNQLSVSANILNLILDSLSRVEDECCTAHFLLGFVPYQPAATDLTSGTQSNALMRVVYDVSVDSPWINDWNVLSSLRTGSEEAISDHGLGLGPPPPPFAGTHATLMTQLEAFRRRQYCLEIFFRLCQHAGTREPTLRLLMSAHASSRLHLGDEPDGLLLGMAKTLPNGFLGNNVVKHIRQQVLFFREGGDLARSAPQVLGPDIPFEKLWGGGRFDCSDEEIEEMWEGRIGELGLEGLPELLEKLMEVRWLCEDEERLLEDALEPMLQFYHQCGWFLRTVAVLVGSARHVEGVAASRGGHAERGAQGISRDRAQSLLRELFGEPEHPGTAGAGAGGNLPMWTPGKFQSLLAEALDVAEVEGTEQGGIHDALEAADLENSSKLVDRWTDLLFMYDEKMLQDRLYKQLLIRHNDALDDDAICNVHRAAELCIRRRVLNAYDGYNTVRRCRSAREHLLCGLQDVLEEAMRGSLLCDILHLDASHWHVFLFDLLGTHLLPKAEACLAHPQVADHVSRMMSLVISAITSSNPNLPPRPSDRPLLLRFLSLLVSLPTRSSARSSLTQRGALYTAILKLIQYLRRHAAHAAPSPADSRTRHDSEEELEEVVAQHRAALLEAAVKDLAVPEGANMVDQHWECRATALGVVQAMLPAGQAPPMQPGAAAPTLRGIAAHHNLVRHLTDDLEGSTGLAELLDVTRTEERQPLLLMFTGKMAVLLQMAQQAEGLRELTEGRVLHKMAESKFLRAHTHDGRQVQALVRPVRGGMGVLRQRFHHLLLPTLKLWVALLHNVPESGSVHAPALLFLWNHREIVREIISPGDRAAEMLWQEADEMVEERRLLVEGVFMVDRMGGFGEDAQLPDTLSAAQAAELDRGLCSWVAQLTARLLEEGAKSSFWQHVEGGGDRSAASLVGGAGALAGGVEGEQQERASRKARLLLQTCELALRLLLRRTSRSGQLLFDCAHFLAMARQGGRGRPYDKSQTGKEEMALEPLVHFFCRCVEQLCGGDAAVVAPGTSAAGTAGGGLTSSGAVSFWSRLRDIGQQREALRGGEGPADASPLQLRARTVEREFRALTAQIRRLLSTCEVALSLIVHSIAAAMRLRDKSAADAAPGHVWVAPPASNARSGFSGSALQYGTKSCSEMLWNRHKSGAAQRLLQFYRERYEEQSLECDWPYVQRVSSQLLLQLQLLQPTSS